VGVPVVPAIALMPVSEVGRPAPSNAIRLPAVEVAPVCLEVSPM
jgi:hypothetical protein